MRACRCPRALSKGLARKKHVTARDVDQKQLRAGIKIEREHTSDPCVARCIALDHLAEHPDYYARLKKAHL